MNGDDIPDAIVPISSGMVYALNGTDGSVIWNTNTGRASLVSTGAIADMDGNGIVDIFLDGMLIAHRIVDLSIVKGDITFDNNLPEEGDTLHISALVYNQGTKNADDAIVKFTDLYDNTMTDIGTDTINVTSGSTAEAAIDYVIDGGGEHTILVTLDPDEDFEEYDETNNEASKTMTVTSHWSIELSSDEPNKVVDPGNQAIFTLKVKNTGDMENVISLAVSSAIPQGWSPSLPTDEVTLGPSEDQSVFFLVTTSSSSMGGDYVLNVTGTSDNKSTNHDTLSLIITIRGDYGFRIVADKTEMSINTEGLALFEINITNIGNSRDAVVLEHNPPSNSSWLFLLSTQRVDLASSEHKIVTLSVKPPFDTNEGDFEVCTINATSEGDPVLFESLSFTTRIVRPDISATDMTFHRKDGVQVDGITKHLIANRTSTVNVTMKNILGNVDYMASIMVEIYVDGHSYGNGAADLILLENGVVSMDTSFDIGDHTVSGCADANGFIDETDETNNCIHKTISVKSPNSVGPYAVYGTVFWPSGDKLVDADVSITNLRTNESFALKTDHNGNYSSNIQELPSGYIEEDMIEVKVSNGVTTRSITFRAYSEDMGKKVDIVLTPGPYDFFIGPQVKIFTEPGKAAVFPMTVSQMGNATNNITLTLTGLPDGWQATMQDQFGQPVGNIIISEGQDYALNISIIPKADESANEAGTILTLTGTSNIQSDKDFEVALIVGILQTYEINVTYQGGTAIKGESATFNVSITNLGNGEDVVVPTIWDNPSGWAMTFSSDKVNLTYKATKNLLVHVDVPYNASIGTNTVGVRLSYGSNQHIDMPLDVVVTDYDYSFEIVNNDLSQREIIPGGTQSFGLTVMNEGNVDNTVSLVVTGQPSDWEARITNSFGMEIYEVDIPVGESEVILLQVEAPRETKSTRNLVLNISGISTKKPSEKANTLALLSVKAADITPEGSLELSKKTPVDGQEVQISVVVRNTGTAAVQGTIALFLVDNKTLGQVNIDYIAPNGNTTVSIKWKAKAGSHTILVKLNPNGTLIESNYDNNILKIDVFVKDKSRDLPVGMVYGILLIAFLISVVFVLHRKGHFDHILRHDDDEEDEDEDDYEDDEDDYEDDDELVEVEIIEVVPERPKKKKGKKKGKGPVKKKVTKKRKTVQKKKGKKVAKPWTSSTDYDEEALHAELDAEDSGIMRLG